MANFFPPIIGLGDRKLKIQKNGVDVATFSANEQNYYDGQDDVPIIANIEVPTSDIITNTTGQFKTITGGLLESCDVTLTPKQDLHGYDKPWVGGSGKNKLSGLEQGSFDTYGNDVAATNRLRSKDFVPINASTTYVISAQANANVRVNIFEFNSIGSAYSVTSSWKALPFNFTTGASTSYVLVMVKFSDDANITPSDVVNPQIETGSTATTYEPYENICSIIGHSSVEVDVCGENLFNPNKYEEIDLTGTGTIRYGHEFGSGNYTLCQYSGSVAYYYRLPTKDLSDRGSSVMLTSSPVNVTVDNNHLLWVFAASWNNADGVSVVNGHDKSYISFNGTDYTISLGQTVYGGSLDVVSGVLTVDRASYTFTGSETWNDFSASGSISYTINSMKQGLATELNPKSMCSTMEISNTNVQGKCMFGGTSSPYRAFWILGAVGMGLDTKAKVQAYTTGMQIVYLLDNPIVIQLTPTQIETLIGQNNISVPLEGQSLDSLSYREMFAWDDVENTFADKAYNKDYLKSKNLIGLGTQLNGFVSGGNQFTPDSSAIGFVFGTSDLPDKITFNAVNGNRAYYAYFNTYPQNGTTCESKDQSSQTLPRTITVNKQYTYIHIQFSYGVTNLSNIQVEEGSEATTYTPYVYSNVDLDALKADKSSIGTDESGRTTASRQYKKTEHFYKDGKFGTAKTDIASGATFTENTNYVKGSISDYLSVKEYTNAYVHSSNSEYVTIHTNSIVRCGYHVSVQLRISVNNMPSTPNQNLIVLPFNLKGSVKFGQINSNTPPFDIVSTGVYMSSGTSILRQHVQLPNGDYYISIDYITDDAL